MGYTITIGEANPVWPTDPDESNEPDWEVKGLALDGAPEFPGDSMTGKGSSRSPSYSTWSEFCRNTGLYDLFFGARYEPGREVTRDVCLMRSHPGVAMLRPSDLLEIRHARIQWEAKSWPTPERIAGWDPTKAWNDNSEPDPRYDGNLARLIWLEWWVAYALENMKRPALGNR